MTAPQGLHHQGVHPATMRCTTPHSSVRRPARNLCVPDVPRFPMHLFDASTLLAYLAAAIVLVLMPGPGTAWILAQSFAGGTRRGIQAGLGLETATLLHAVAAGLGLSALLATSAVA